MNMFKLKKPEVIKYKIIGIKLLVLWGASGFLKNTLGCRLG